MPARQVPDCPHPANITSPSQIPTHLRKHPQESSPYSALAFACNSTTEARLQLALKPVPHRFQADREGIHWSVRVKPARAQSPRPILVRNLNRPLQNLFVRNLRRRRHSLQC